MSFVLSFRFASCLFRSQTCNYVSNSSSSFCLLFISQQQSARYFNPHERNNESPTAGNLTVLNSAQCFPPPAENLLNRPSCLTCPTIADHCDHPSSIPPHSSHFHPFHHSMHGSTPQLLPPNKSLLANQHTIYDSCQKWVVKSLVNSSPLNLLHLPTVSIVIASCEVGTSVMRRTAATTPTTSANASRKNPSRRRTA